MPFRPTSTNLADSAPAFTIAATRTCAPGVSIAFEPGSM